MVKSKSTSNTAKAPTAAATTNESKNDETGETEAPPPPLSSNVNDKNSSSAANKSNHSSHHTRTNRARHLKYTPISTQELQDTSIIINLSNSNSSSRRQPNTSLSFEAASGSFSPSSPRIYLSISLSVHLCVLLNSWVVTWAIIVVVVSTHAWIVHCHNYPPGLLKCKSRAFKSSCFSLSLSFCVHFETTRRHFSVTVALIHSVVFVGVIASKSSFPALFLLLTQSAAIACSCLGFNLYSEH